MTRLTISQQPIPLQTSADEVQSAQSLDDKLQPFIQYLKDGNLPDNASTVDYILKQEGKYFLSEDNILGNVGNQMLRIRLFFNWWYRNTSR